MNTIIVVYTPNKASDASIAKKAKYAFNTNCSVQVGDILESSSYNDYMQVVKVLDRSYIYYNKHTGELSDEYTSTGQWHIKELVLREENPEVVYASRVMD